MEFPPIVNLLLNAEFDIKKEAPKSQAAKDRSLLWRTIRLILLVFLLISAVGAFIDDKGVSTEFGLIEEMQPTMESNTNFNAVTDVDKAKAELEETVHYFCSGSEFEERVVGARRVGDLFSAAKKWSPCIIFIDVIVPPELVDRIFFLKYGGTYMVLKEFFSKRFNLPFQQVVKDSDGDAVKDEESGKPCFSLIHKDAGLLDKELAASGKLPKGVLLPKSDLFSAGFTGKDAGFVALHIFILEDKEMLSQIPISSGPNTLIFQPWGQGSPMEGGCHVDQDHGAGHGAGPLRGEEATE